MNTLTGIEAERVNQILKLAIDRLQILSHVPIVWDDDIYSEISEPVIAMSLEKLWNSGIEPLTHSLILLTYLLTHPLTHSSYSLTQTTN